MAMAPAGGVAGQAEVFGGEQGQHGLLLADYTSNECVHRDKQTELRGVCSQAELGRAGQFIAIHEVLRRLSGWARQWVRA